MQLFLIDPHRKDFYNNGLFSNNKYPELIIFKQLRSYLKTKNILLETIDRHSITQGHQIFFFDHKEQGLFKNRSFYLDQCIRLKVIKKKLNLIIWECPIIKPSNFNYKNYYDYQRVFTWNDRFVDHKKYYPYRWPQHLLGLNTKTIPFNKKKFITLINAFKTNYHKNELYSLRIKAIRYFEKFYSKDFDLYGRGWEKPLDIKYAYSLFPNISRSFKFINDYINSYQPYTSFRGPIKNKYDILKNYRFVLCFENMTNINGYVTEKIFDCFKAKTIPVYYGANNIKDYIPDNLFIDWTQFNDFAQLALYLQSFSSKKYQEHIDRIVRFNSTIAKDWGYLRFANDIFLNSKIYQ